MSPRSTSAPHRIGVVTIVAGRHDHLRAHVQGLARSSRPVDVHVVVSMGDAQVEQVVVAAWQSAATWRAPLTTCFLIEVPTDGELPLAGARNTGADEAARLGCDLLVFLDVDCLVGPDAITWYERAWDEVRAESGQESGRESGQAQGGVHDGPVLLSGPVTYLPSLPAGLTAYPLDGLEHWAWPHPARPAPPAGSLERAGDLRLFWSLSFATGVDDWHAVGGFPDGYRGYGGEDTDFAMRVASRGGALYWVGGADVYHQYHPVESPPVRHLRSIVRNANQFRDRWGWFPMEGWLRAFELQGLAARDVATDRWVVLGRDESPVVPDVARDHPVEG